MNRQPLIQPHLKTTLIIFSILSMLGTLLVFGYRTGWHVSDIEHRLSALERECASAKAEVYSPTE